MLIRHITTGRVHEVVAGTRYARKFFEEVTREQLAAEQSKQAEPPQALQDAPKAPLKSKTEDSPSAKKKPSRRARKGHGASADNARNA